MTITARGHIRLNLYAKHCQLADQPSFASTAFLSDSVYKDRLGDWKMGLELCLLAVADDGQVTSETLLRQPEGTGWW
jgi:hypothetical protein